jgi:hypothetical protein
VAVTVGALALVPGTAANAAGTLAKTTAASGSGWLLKSSEDGGALYAASPSVKNKAELGPVPSESGAGIQPNVARTVGCLYPSATSTITPPGGSTDIIKASGSSSIVLNYTPSVAITGVNYNSISSKVSWLGGVPYNADSVTLVEQWDIDYVAVSWSFSASPSGSISLGSGRVQWSATVSNNWTVSHTWNTVKETVSGGAISNAEYDVIGQFQFGSAFHSVTASSNHNTPMDGILPLPWSNC